MLTEGQSAALRQLQRIARVEHSPLRIDHVNEPASANASLTVQVSLDCTRYEYKEGGLKLHARESVRLKIAPDFPYVVPTVNTAHTRFRGFPHVQWARHLCVYLSTETQWQPSQGMFGLIRQLGDWFEKAALNELDALEGPIHPPVAYPSATTTFCMQANTPDAMQWPWFGAAVLDWRKDDLHDVVDWKVVGELPADETFAPVMLLNFELPFEYPTNVFDLLSWLEEREVETNRVVVHLMLAAERLGEGESLHVIVGAPSRGVAGDINQRKQHLQVWEIEPIDVLRLKNVALACDVMARYTNESTPDDLRRLVASVFDSLEDWKKQSRVRWCWVLENRAEIVTRRDEGTPMNWFIGKAIALWGCGALGGQIAEQLVRAGVGELRLYDCGCVHPGILVRQNFTDADINDNKAVALKRRVEAIVPRIPISAHPENVISTTLNSNDWHAGVDVVIDATASLRIRSKLELVLKGSDRVVPVVAMMISGKARHGALVVTPTAYSGGPMDAYRRLGLAAKHRSWLSECADAFWGGQELEPLRQPEPGCSDPTFVGSHADIGGLTARMMNHAAAALKDDAHHAVGVLINSDASSMRDAKFEFEPDVVVRAKGTEFRLAANAWRDTQGWVRAGARTRTPEDETGGLMFGTIDEMLGVAWISNVSGPPSDSEFSPEQFLCGVDGIEELCDSYDARSKGTTQYVGTWHSHPVSGARPSGTDFHGIGSIFAMNPGGGAHQLMMIVGHASSRSADIGLYFFEKQSVDHTDSVAELEMIWDGSEIRAPELPRRHSEIGLALSGGGSRAVAFHLGTLRALEDLGLLDEVAVVSGVSGGSVMTGLLGYTNEDFREVDDKTTAFLRRGLAWPAIGKLLNPIRFVQIVIAFIVVTVPSIALRLSVGGLKLITAVLPGSAKINAALSRVRWPIPRWYSRTHVMRDAMTDLVGTQTCDAPTRQNKAIVFNACELRTTTAFRMSNKKFGSWRFGWSKASNLSIAEAVTASAAFPPMLPPFDWTHEFTKNDETQRQRVLITDGGVFDNIGVSVMEPGRDSRFSAISHPVNVIIASDASAGQLSGGDLPASWASRMTQAFNSVMRKVNDATKQRLHTQAAHGDIERFVYVNLGQIDQQVPLKAPGWIDREQVVNYPTNFSSMSPDNILGLSGRGESITRSLVTLYLLSD